MHSLIAQPLGSVCTCACIVAFWSTSSAVSQWYSVWGPKCSCCVPPFPSAHRPFSLADLNDYQTHCTVMNYREDAELKNILYDDFVPLFEQQYPDHPWREVEVRRHRQCNTGIITPCLRGSMLLIVSRSHSLFLGIMISVCKHIQRVLFVQVPHAVIYVYCPSCMYVGEPLVIHATDHSCSTS